MVMLLHWAHQPIDTKIACFKHTGTEDERMGDEKPTDEQQQQQHRLRYVIEWMCGVAVNAPSSCSH